MGEVLQAVAHQPRPAVRRHLGDPHGQLGHRPISPHPDPGHRIAQDLQVLGQGWAVEGQGSGVVQGLLYRRPVDPFRLGQPHHLVAHMMRRAPGTGPVGQPLGGEVEDPGLDRGRRPGRLGHPAPRNLHRSALRPGGVGQEGPQHGLGHDPGGLALEPVRPPAHLLEGPIQAHGFGQPRIGVAPGPDQPLARDLEVGEQPADRVGIGVLPAAHHIGRDLDGRPVQGHRAPPPIVIEGLMFQPGGHDRRRRLQALTPHRLPVRPHHLRIRRPGHHRLEPHAPLQVGVADRPADIVRVIGISIVRTAQRHDRLERRGPQGRDLQGVDPAPGDAAHPHGAGAPGLSGDPGDDLYPVRQLRPIVLVDHHPFGIPRPAHIDPHIGDAVAGQLLAPGAVMGPVAVALAIGDVFQHRGNRRVLGALRQEQPRRQPHPVRHGDPDMLGHRDRPRLRQAPGRHGRRPQPIERRRHGARRQDCSTG